MLSQIAHFSDILNVSVVRLEVTYFDRYPHIDIDTDLYNNLLVWRGQMSSENPCDKSSIGHRFMEEMRAYAIISLYLWVCFSALLLYETTVLRADNVQFLPIGTAVVKALILGKFILIGKAIKVGVRIKPGSLLYRIVWKSLAMLLFLLVLTAIEELIVGLVHGQATSEIIAEFINQSWLQEIARCVVMLLVLIPMISFEEIDHVLGDGSLKRMLFGQSDHE
jgi:hypothetical protein